VAWYGKSVANCALIQTHTHTECNTLQKEIWPKLRGNCNR